LPLTTLIQIISALFKCTVNLLSLNFILSAFSNVSTPSEPKPFIVLIVTEDIFFIISFNSIPKSLLSVAFLFTAVI
jgi:hypothetical protein